MFSEEMNGKNPEEMETAECGEVTENVQTEIKEEPETAEAEVVEKTADIETQEESEVEGTLEEFAEEEPAVEEETTEAEKSGKLQELLAAVKEKAALVMEKVLAWIPKKAEPEETVETQEEEIQEAAEECVEAAVEETTVPEEVSQEEEAETEEAVEAEETVETEEAVEEEEAVETDPAEGEESPVQEEVEAEPEETAEEEEGTSAFRKKLKSLQKKLAEYGWLRVSVIAVCALVLIGALVFAVLRTVGVEVKPRENNVQFKTEYLADEAQLEKKAEVVVATIGDKQLTNSELQLYYVNAIYTFYSQNYYYMDYLGLNLEAPLSQQPCTLDETMNWEQYFLEAALQSWQSYTLVELMAEQDGYVVSEEVQAQIDSMPQQLESIAVAYGYGSAEEYLRTETAPGVTAETYLHFNEVYYITSEYLNTFYTDGYPTDAEITAYYTENQDVFEANGIKPEMGLVSDVRHILIKPKGGTVSEDGLETVYSEEELQTALSEAERILTAWEAGEATEESFATMANTYSEDSGSNTTGGLYEAVDPFTNFVPEFLNWAIDMNRQPGDVEIVKTSHGYHIMYFVKGQDYFSSVVGEQLVAERIQNKLTAVKEEYPMNAEYKKILLCEPVF